MTQIVLFRKSDLRYLDLTRSGFATDFNDYTFVDTIEEAFICSPGLNNIPFELRRQINSLRLMQLEVEVTRTVTIIDILAPA